MGKGSSPGKDHSTLGPVFRAFDPRGGAANVVDNHLILIAAAGTEGKFTCLIGGDGFARFVNGDEDVFSW